MLIFRGGNWPLHRPWFVATSGLTAAALVWYGWEAHRSGSLPGGSSRPGFTFGVVGGAILLFEMLLGVRKKFRTVRIGRASLWMKAHVWLGLLCLPLLTLHSGFRGWTAGLSGALMAALFVAVASGAWGLTLQQIVPSIMLETLPSETIHSQIDRILGQNLDEARRLVRVTCGQGETAVSQANRTAAGTGEANFLVVGAVRTAGRVQGKSMQTQNFATPVSGSEPLLSFFEEVVVPFFEAKTLARSPLGSAARSGALFREIKTRVNPAAHGVVDTLERQCDQRREFARQASLHTWLHVWLCVHLPASAGLFVLMLIHIYFALFYI